jgi:hypothetical protein
MNTDAELLQRYVSDHSEDAFAENITRHDFHATHVNSAFSAPSIPKIVVAFEHFPLEIDPARQLRSPMEQ